METLELKIAGLYTAPNPFSACPAGALFLADNLVIDNDFLAQLRRGNQKYGSIFGSVIEKYFQYEGTLMASSSGFLYYDSDNNGSWIKFTGNFDIPFNTNRLRSVEANRNFYITSSSGIQKSDSVFNGFRSSGGPIALGGSATLVNPGFMPNQVQVAYRLVWGYPDANNNEIVGVPSQRLVIANNTGAAANVVLTWQIPSEVTTNYFYRIYRSGPSADINSVPDDELQQVKEGNPASSEISAGEFTFTDNVPDSLLGAFLYTDPSQEGIEQANDQPPLAIDMALFRNSVFYFNTVSKQRYNISLIAVGDNTLGGAFGYQTNNGTTHTNTTIDGLTKKASVIIQDLTFTADLVGPNGNNINITYISGGTAGSEVVTVIGSDISVKIQSGVSTATQIKTKVDASGPASALVDTTISGTGSNPQTTVSQTFLSDGFDTSTLNVGMRVSGTGVQSGTKIVSIDSSSSITVTPATIASSTVAIEFDDIFRINDLEYYATIATNVTNHEFKVFLTGTPGQNIENTSYELLKVINKDTRNTLVYGYYESGPEDLPGLILFQERGVGGNAFSLTSTNGDSFSPTLSNTGMNNISSNDAKQNRVMISKPLQPEAVPLLNFLAVGSENFPIRRGIALRESVFILKDEGIYKITGNSFSDFQVSLFDSSAKIRAPESAVVLNNQIFCYSSQGIITISETGVRIISRPIENTLLQISSEQFTNFENNSFAISYESDRKYIFYTLSEPDDIYPTQAFVFNTLTNTFTRWPLLMSAGIVLLRDNKLYQGNWQNLYAYQERKNFDRSDYADDQYNIVITDFNGTNVTIASATDKFSTDFSTSLNFGTVTTGGTVSFGNGVTITKTSFGFENGGIFATKSTLVTLGDQITFDFKFSDQGLGFQFISVLSNDSNLTQFGTYRVGLSCYIFGGQYFVVIRDDGAEITDHQQEVFPNTLYNAKFTFNNDGTLNAYIKKSTDANYLYVGTNDLGNTSSLLGQNLYFMCSGFDNGTTIELFNFLWVSVSQDLPINLVGDLIRQNGNEALIEEDLGGGKVIVSDIIPWISGSAILYQSINGVLQWLQNSSDNPGFVKHFPECTVIFKDTGFKTIELGFQTNFDNSFDTIDLLPGNSAAWGSFPWGEAPWGIGGGRPIAVRTYIPLEKQRASWINYRIKSNQAYSNFQLAGISTQYENSSARFV